MYDRKSGGECWGVCPWKEIGTASEFDSRVQDGEYGAILFLVDGYQSFLVPYALGFEYGTIKAYIYDITNLYCKSKIKKGGNRWH